MANHFLQTLRHLRTYEEIILYNNLLSISQQQQQDAAAYLAEEYRSEAVNYPFTAPAFNPQAALWAAGTVYISSQLILNREHKESDIVHLLPPYGKNIDPPAILSADLLLRFLPHIIHHLKAINPEDKLIEISENHLKTWHYSGTDYPLPVDELFFDTIVSDKCLYQLYVDRIIENRQLPLAKHPLLVTGVKASLGMFGGVYWNDFTQQVIAHEHN